MLRENRESHRKNKKKRRSIKHILVMKKDQYLYQSIRYGEKSSMEMAWILCLVEKSKSKLKKVFYCLIWGFSTN
jgi:hypothetical protein